MDTALAEAVTFVKKGIKNKGLVLASLLDVDGVFNHTTKETIVKGAEDHLVPNTVSRWLWRMLSSRRVETHWGSHSEEIKVGKGCPQGGVLSPTMWCLVIDELIRLLNEAGFFSQAYADDILILVKADDEHVLSGLIQRLAIAGITGSPSTTPLAAVELILGIPPLPAFIKGEANKSWWRIREVIGTGGGLDQELGQALPPEIEASGCDKIGRSIIFRKPYTVHISDRKEWANGTHPYTQSGVVWYTDGSKNENGVGVGAWKQGSSTELVYTLDSHASVFQAEVRAIAECAAVQLTRNNWGCPISICSDSRVALMAFSCTSIYSKEVLHCIDILTALAHNQAVTFIWVPEHVGIRGNEKADSLAGRGVRRVRATQCSVGVPPGEIKKRTSLLMKEEILRGILRDTPPEQWLQDIGRLNKSRLRRVVGWLMGHWWVRYYLYKRTILNEGNCRWCRGPEAVMGPGSFGTWEITRFLQSVAGNH